MSCVARFLFLPVLFLCSCTQEMIRQIPKTEFASEPLQPWNAPFQGLWLNPKAKDSQKAHHKIYLAPVTTKYLTESPRDKWFPKEYAEATRKLSSRFDEQIRAHLVPPPNAKYTLVSSPHDADITIELAIVKLDRTLVSLNILSLGTSFFIPGVSSAIGLVSKGDIAMVGKIRDNRTKQLLAVFGDYRTDEPTLFGSLRDYTLYGSHEKAIDMWSRKLAELINKGNEGKVDPAIWFTLDPF